MKKNKILLSLLLIYSFSFSQENLLKELESQNEYKTTNNFSAFKAIKIVNNQSTKQQVKRNFIYMFLIDLALLTRELIHYLA